MRVVNEYRRQPLRLFILVPAISHTVHSSVYSVKRRKDFLHRHGVGSEKYCGGGSFHGIVHRVEAYLPAEDSEHGFFGEVNVLCSVFSHAVVSERADLRFPGVFPSRRNSDDITRAEHIRQAGEILVVDIDNRVFHAFKKSGFCGKVVLHRSVSVHVLFGEIRENAQVGSYRRNRLSQERL